MVAQYAFRAWRRARTPAGFEICELGAGNGQLCLDTLSQRPQASHVPVRRYVEQSVREFLSDRTRFKLLITRP